MPMLRTEFETSSNKVWKARLYVTSRGIYEMYLNGQRVGEEYFNPGVTQYNKTHLYQVYDVTKLIAKGKNAVGAILAEDGGVEEQLMPEKTGISLATVSHCWRSWL